MTDEGRGRKWQREYELRQSPPSGGGKPHNKPMPGCCGGLKPVAYMPQVTRDGRTKMVRIQPQMLDEGGEIVPMIPVEFIGHRVGGFNVYGPVTKRSYRFSTFNRVVKVDQRDLEQVLLNADFRLVKEIPEGEPEPRKGYNPLVDTPIEQSPAMIAAREAARRAEEPRQTESHSQGQGHIIGTHSPPLPQELVESLQERDEPARAVRTTGPPEPADPEKSSIGSVMAKERSRQTRAREAAQEPQTESPPEEEAPRRRVRRVKGGGMESRTTKVNPKILGN